MGRRLLSSGSLSPGCPSLLPSPALGLPFLLSPPFSGKFGVTALFPSLLFRDTVTNNVISARISSARKTFRTDSGLQQERFRYHLCFEPFPRFRLDLSVRDAASSSWVSRMLCRGSSLPVLSTCGEGPPPNPNGKLGPNGLPRDPRGHCGSSPVSSERAKGLLRLPRGHCGSSPVTSDRAKGLFRLPRGHGSSAVGSDVGAEGVVWLILP